VQTEIDQLMKEHESQATKAYIHLRNEKATKVMRNIEKQSETVKQYSQSSMKTFQKEQEFNKANLNSCLDNTSQQVDENASGEYDRITQSDRANNLK